MNRNDNFDITVAVKTHAQEWVASPMPGVHRKPLDRIGGEVARATSIVKYAANSHFSSHVHNGGEEFIVLEGTFEDEHGSYPAGTYVRNPPMSSHTPGSTLGCTIFVKLWQFDLADEKHVVRNMFTDVQKHNALQTLFENTYEQVFTLGMLKKQVHHVEAHGGIEILVLDGEVSVTEGNTVYSLQKHDWFRQGPNKTAIITASENSTVWIKQDHLVHVASQLQVLQQATSSM